MFPRYRFCSRNLQKPSPFKGQPRRPHIPLNWPASWPVPRRSGRRLLLAGKTSQRQVPTKGTSDAQILINQIVIWFFLIRPVLNTSGYNVLSDLMSLVVSHGPRLFMPRVVLQTWPTSGGWQVAEEDEPKFKPFGSSAEDNFLGVACLIWNLVTIHGIDDHVFQLEPPTSNVISICICIHLPESVCLRRCPKTKPLDVPIAAWTRSKVSHLQGQVGQPTRCQEQQHHWLDLDNTGRRINSEMVASIHTFNSKDYRECVGMFRWQGRLRPAEETWQLWMKQCPGWSWFQDVYCKSAFICTTSLAKGRQSKHDTQVSQCDFGGRKGYMSAMPPVSNVWVPSLA